MFFGDLTVLVGKNGSGKTNIIEALFRFFNDLAISGGGVPSEFNDYFWFDRNTNVPIRIEVTFKLEDETEVKSVFSLPDTVLQNISKRLGEKIYEISIARQIVNLQTGWKTEYIKWGDLEIVSEDKIIDPNKLTRFLIPKELIADYKMFFFTPEELGGARLLVDTNRNIAYHSNPQIDSLVATNIIESLINIQGMDYKAWASEQGITLNERPPKAEEFPFLTQPLTQDMLQQLATSIVQNLKGKFKYMPSARDNRTTLGVRSSLIDSQILENMRTIFISLNRSDEIRRDRLSNWAEDFLKKRLEPNPAQVLTHDGNLHLPIPFLGGGEQELLFIMWNLLEPGFIYAIEEPENHFHPDYSRKFLKFLKNVICEKSQVIITTHSPILVDKIETRNNWLIRIGESGTETSQIENREMLKLVLSELGMVPSDIYLKDYVLFVEGGTEKEAVIPIFASKLGLEDIEEFVAIIAVGGEPQIRNYLNIWLELLEYSPIEYSILMDKHSEALAFDLIRDKQMSQKRFLILEKGSIEDYYPIEIVKSALKDLFGIEEVKIDSSKARDKEIEKILKEKNKLRGRWKIIIGEYVAEEMPKSKIPKEVKTIINRIRTQLSK